MTSNTAEQRWAAAAKLAAGIADEELPGRRRRVLIPVVGVVGAALLLLVVTFIAVLIAIQSGRVDPSAGRPDPELWRVVLAGVIVAAGIAVFGFGTVWAVRTKRFTTHWSGVAIPLNRAETASVRRQIAGKEPVDPEHLSTILAIARQHRRMTLGSAPMFAGIVLAQSGNAIGVTSLVPAILYLVGIAAFVVLGFIYAHLYRQAGVFLEKHDSAIALDR